MCCNRSHIYFFVAALFIAAHADAAATLDGYWELVATRTSPNGPDIPNVKTAYGLVRLQMHYDRDRVTKFAFDERGFMFKFVNIIERSGDRLTELNREKNLVAEYDIISLSDKTMVLAEVGTSIDIFVYSRIPVIHDVSKSNIKQTIDFSFQTTSDGKSISGGWTYENVFRGSDSPTISCNYFPSQNTFQILSYEFSINPAGHAQIDPARNKSVTIRLKNVNVSDQPEFPSFRLSKIYSVTNYPAQFRFSDPKSGLLVDGNRDVSVCNGKILRKKMDLDIQVSCSDSTSDIRVRALCQIN